MSTAKYTGLVHFVGFRDDRYWNAVRIWGEPDFIHLSWDRYAADEVAPEDIVVFAQGGSDQKPRSFSVEAAATRRDRRGKKRRSGELEPPRNSDERSGTNPG